MANLNTSANFDAGRVDEAEEARVDDADFVIASSDTGTLLCATRMRMGKDLQVVAEALHIRYNYLVAIEDGRYEVLPGQAYAVGFVRSYADYLGLDGTEMVRRYKEESAGVKRKASFEFLIPTPDSGVPSGALLLLAVVSGMVVYGAWYSIAGLDRSAVQLIQEVPSRLMALLESDDEALSAGVRSSENLVGPTTAVAAVRVGNGSESGAPASLETMVSESAVPPTAAELPNSSDVNRVANSMPAGQTSSVAGTEEASETQPVVSTSSSESTTARSSVVDDAESVEMSSSAPPPESAIESPTSATVESASSVDTPESAASAETDDELDGASDGTNKPNSSDAEPQQAASAEEVGATDVVELRARIDSWIQLREGEELLLTQLLRKGKTFKVPERPGLTPMTGNAVGLEILVNGEVLPPLRVEGTVARGVPLDP